MAEDDFRRVLGLGATALDEHVDTAPWLATIAAAYGSATAATRSSTLPEALQRSRLAGFLTVVAPMIDAGCDRLRRQARPLVRPASGCRSIRLRSTRSCSRRCQVRCCTIGTHAGAGAARSASPAR
jgi:hypothetical protein